MDKWASTRAQTIYFNPQKTINGPTGFGAARPILTLGPSSTSPFSACRRSLVARFLPPSMALPLANPPSRLSLKLPTNAGGSPLRPSSSNCDPRAKEFPPNAVRRKIDRLWRAGFSLGVDLGLSRTGLALSKGYSVRPLTVIAQSALSKHSIARVYFPTRCWKSSLERRWWGFRFSSCEGRSWSCGFLKSQKRRYSPTRIRGLQIAEKKCALACIST